MFKIVRLDRCKPLIRVVNEFSTTGRQCKESDEDNSNNKNRQIATSKLQELLTKLATENAEKQKEKSKIKIPHPVRKVFESRPTYKVKLDKIPSRHTAKLVEAVKDVADHIGGPSVQTTEAELLHVILNSKRPDDKAVGDLKLESVISGMQVEKSEDSRASQVRRSLPKERRERTQSKREMRPQSTMNIFNQKPLGIFPRDFRGEPPPFELRTWSNMAARELKILVTHPPSNIYEEMITWTEKGKLWKFPIDNEQGLDDEKNVDFTEHVFLEEHLKPWCPNKGPIRQFMELITIGLSKNPYITVQAKIEHINWFRDYFESKKKLLRDIGALPDSSPSAKEVSS